MILYKKEPYHLQMKNIMLLDDAKSGGVVYVNKTTYDQALLLHSRFDGSTDRVLALLKNKKTEVYIAIPGLKGLMEEMCKSMPEPLNILAPFLVFAAQNQGITWDAKNREMGYGILHQYSQLVDFNAITLVPAEVRTNITIPTGILLKYEDSWDDLCSSLAEKIVEVQGAVSVVPVQQVVQPTPVVATPVVQPSPAPVVQSTPAPVAPTPVQPAPTPGSSTSSEGGEMSFIERLRASRMASEEAAKKEQEEKSKNKPASTPTPAPAIPAEAPKANALMGDKVAEEKKEVNAILDDTDF